MYDAYNANREQWQCACTIALPRCSLSSTKIMQIESNGNVLAQFALPRCSLSSTKIHKNPELLASRDKEITCRCTIDNQLNISVQ